MRRIETELAIHAPIEEVFETISQVENIPLYAPGIDQATARKGPPESVANLLDLVTRSGRRLEGEVLAAQPHREWAVRDENGTIARWSLRMTPDGVWAKHVLEGEFEARKEPELRSEVRAKIARLVIDIERSSGRDARW